MCRLISYQARRDTVRQSRGLGLSQFLFLVGLGRWRRLVVQVLQIAQVEPLLVRYKAVA